MGSNQVCRRTLQFVNHRQSKVRLTGILGFAEMGTNFQLRSNFLYLFLLFLRISCLALNSFNSIDLIKKHDRTFVESFSNYMFVIDIILTRLPLVFKEEQF